jgi:hypothetical protein
VQGICMKLYLVTCTLLPLSAHTFATAVNMLMETPEKLLVWLWNMFLYSRGFLPQMQNDSLWVKSWLFGNARWSRELENVVVGGGLRIWFIMKCNCPACEVFQDPLWCCRIQMFLSCVFCQNAWHWFIWDASLISISSVVTHWSDAMTVQMFL